MLVQSVKLNTSERKRENGEDRLKNTLFDGLMSDKERIGVAEYFMKQNSLVGQRSRFAWLVTHAMILRSETPRDLQFADINSLQLPNHGSSTNRVLLFYIDKTKTNQNGTVQYSACLRHTNVKLCPVGALAIYLFDLWYISKRSTPNFGEDDWFSDRVMSVNSSNKKSMVAYDAIYTPFKKALEFNGITTSQVTHVGRKSGAMHAEFNGVSESQIGRLGRWNMKTLEKTYLSPIPQEAILVMSGHRKDQSYHLTRDSVIPPTVLQSQIFPFLEEIGPTKRHDDLSWKVFSDTLKWLRIVVLQDMAIFIHMNSPDIVGLSIFNHKLFKSAEFLAFK